MVADDAACKQFDGYQLLWQFFGWHKLSHFAQRHDSD